MNQTERLNFRIDLDKNSAHVSLEHTGEFTLESPTPGIYLYYEWLESAYLVKENGKLNLNFISLNSELT